MDYQTFEEAVADFCSQIGLRGHEKEYGQILVDNVYTTATGMYSPTSWLNMDRDRARRIGNLHKIMLASEEGRAALERVGLKDKEGVPVPNAHINYEINEVYLLPSANPELKPAVESLQGALKWRREIEAQIAQRERK